MSAKCEDVFDEVTVKPIFVSDKNSKQQIKNFHAVKSRVSKNEMKKDATECYVKISKLFESSPAPLI